MVKRSIEVQRSIQPRPQAGHWWVLAQFGGPDLREAPHASEMRATRNRIRTKAAVRDVFDWMERCVYAKRPAVGGVAQLV